MRFEHPLAWWLAALAVPIVVLHLHLQRRRVVEVSSLLLWRGVIADRAGRGRFRSMRDGLALALLLAALAAFVGAAAGPVTGVPATEPRRLTIVVDASASMTVGPRPAEDRLSQALRRAIEAESRLARQDELCVWVAGETPRVLVDPTTARGAVRRAWGGSSALRDSPYYVFPSLAPSSLALTTRLAREAAAGVEKRPATVLVLTDEVGAESLRDLPRSDVDVRVGVVDAGRAVRNAGIVACDVDPADASRLLVRVATTDGPPAPRSLVLGGATTPLAFDADGAATATVALGELAAKGGLAEVRLEPGDDFAEDDVARLMLPVAKPLAVAVLADAPSPFLVEALRAMPSVADPARTTLVPPGSPASAFAGADVVVADGVAPPAGKPVLAFGGTGRAVERPLLWGVGTHPVLAGVDLSPLRIESAVRVAPSAGDVTIVASAAGAVGVAGESGGVRHVTLGFRPEASTLPLEAAFPLLVRNSLRWLAATSDAPRYVAAGEPLPGGDGAVAPYPEPGGDHMVRLTSGAQTTVRWMPPAGFRLAPAAPLRTTAAEAAVASLPDRRGDIDSRERFGPRLAAIGAVLLAVGAMLLRQRRPEPPTAVPPATGTGWATSTREAATSPRA